MASPGNQHCASCIGTLSFPLVSQSLKGRCYSNQILLVLVYGCRWTQAASIGAAGRASVGLCSVISYIFGTISNHW